MGEDKKTGSKLIDKYLPKNVQEQLLQIFKDVPHEVPLILFTDPASDDQEVVLGRELLQAFDALIENIKFTEYDISHETAAKWGVDRAPTIVFSPDRLDLKYLGIPLGEEGRTLMETIVLLALGHSHLPEQALRVIGEIVEERIVKVFVSPTCPYCPQQAVNAVKAAMENPENIKVQIIDTSFNQDLAEKYGAYSVPQTYANEVLIAKGAQPPELFAASLRSLEEEQYFIPAIDAEQIEVDLVIIGGGPAGLTAGIYAARSGIKAIVLEKDTLGGQMATTPIVENYPGFAHIGGKNLVDIMVTHALEYVNILTKEAVMEIKPGDPIEVVTASRRIFARALLFTTGATYRKLGVPGEDEFSGRGVSFCSTCDGPLFKGKTVLMVGGGNSAVTEAIHLAHMGVSVKLVHRGDKLRAQEQLVRDLEANNITVMYNTELEEIRGREKVSEVKLLNNKSGEKETLPTDGVFISIGYIPQAELARQTGVNISPDGFIEHDGSHRTNINGIYSAGDVEGGYKQIVTATAAGAAAAMTIFEDLTEPYWKRERKTG